MAAEPGVTDVVPEPGPPVPAIGSALEPVAVFALAAMAVGAGWWALDPVLSRAGDRAEVAIAGDAALAIPALVAGLTTALWVILRPGRRPVVRLVVAVVCSLGGSAVSWQVGRSLGVVPLRAYGVLLVWPIVLTVVVGLWNVIASIVTHE